MDWDETLDEDAGDHEKRKGKRGKKGKGKVKKKDVTTTVAYSRGVETMFRSSYRVQMDLSALADTKANIMITINGLILSIILAAISPKIDANPFLLLPTVVVLTTCVISIVYAVLAAMPRVNSSVITLDDVRKNRANILFFGNFSKLTREEYVVGMEELLQLPERLYHNMMHDLYGIGTVLQRKFELLRIAYGTFMIGIIISVLFFIGAYLVAVLSPGAQVAP